jgi:hypothetical protein
MAQHTIKPAEKALVRYVNDDRLYVNDRGFYFLRLPPEDRDPQYGLFPLLIRAEHGEEMDRLADAWIEAGALVRSGTRTAGLTRLVRSAQNRGEEKR